MEHILPSKRFLFRFVKDNLSNVILAHPFQERHEGSEALSVLGVAQLIHQTLGFFLGELLTQVGQQPEEIFAKHGLVGVLSYNFKISTKSWMPPVSLESLAFLKRGYMSSRPMVFLPFSFSPPISAMVFMVGFKL